MLKEEEQTELGERRGKVLRVGYAFALNFFLFFLTELEDSPCGPEGFELEFGCEELG